MSNHHVEPEYRNTTCPLDCPDACSLSVTLEDHRVVKIDGADDGSTTAGFICGKVRNFPHHVYSTERLSSPLRRVGKKGSGDFETISWEQAYQAITQRIAEDREQFGGDSILPVYFGGSNGKLTQGAVDTRFFYRLGASKLLPNVCAAPSTAAFDAMYGKMPGVGYEDYENSKLIVIWGCNPHASGIHLVPFIQKAQRRGAKIVVLDPRKTSFAGKADLHLKIYPGTDLVVALGMVRWLDENNLVDREFIRRYTNGYEQLLDRASQWTVDRAAEIARVEPRQLEKFFRLYGETRPSVIRCGWGPERNRNGGSAIAAILALPAVANRFERSGGFTMSNSNAWRLDSRRVIHSSAPRGRSVNMNVVGEALCGETKQPIRTVFVYNCNPVATLPEQNKVIEGLSRSDLFVVVFDQVMTDTAKYADIVLPATTFLEHRDLRNGYGNSRMGNVVPVIDPVGQSKSNHEVFSELLRRLELARPDDLTTEDEICESLLGQDRFRELTTNGSLVPELGTRPIQMKDVLPGTASGRIELFPDSLTQESQAGLYQYIADTSDEQQFPLALVSPSTSQTVNSTFGYRLTQPARVSLHPLDAESRGIEDSTPVRVFSASGEVFLDAKIDETISPGVASIPKGIWMKHTRNARTSNALCPDSLSDIGAGACFNDTRVEIEAVGESRS